MKTLSKITLAAIAALLLFAPTAFAGGSCMGGNGQDYCGGKSNVGSCWCDSKCSQYGDCCDDYSPVCEDDVAPEPQPEPQPEPAPAYYELECYTETFGPIDVDAGAIGQFTVRCDDDYRATGGGARETSGSLDMIIMDTYPSDNDLRDWVVRYNNRFADNGAAVEGRARCCR